MLLVRNGFLMSTWEALRTKWDCEAQGENLWEFSGPSFSHSLLGWGILGICQGARALGRGSSPGDPLLWSPRE